MSNWRKFWRLPAGERVLFLQAAALLPAVRLGLKTLGWRRVQAAMCRRKRRAGGCASDETVLPAIRTARLVAVAAGLAGGTCLARSIVLACLLERRGIPSELRIGVRKAERGLEAHAWVEAGGRVLNDGQDVTERFAAFDQDFALARVSWR